MPGILKGNIVTETVFVVLLVVIGLVAIFGDRYDPD